MLLFNRAGTHALLSYVASGHLQFIDRFTRQVVSCLDAGVQNHASFPFGYDKFALVANQNGKLLQRVTTDYATNTFVLDDSATLNLATCTTHNGNPCQATGPAGTPGLRPDNAPICPGISEDGKYGFVTLRGGGLLVVDVQASPMAVIAEYDNVTISGNGCGTMPGGNKFYVNSGGASPTNGLRSEIYSLPVNGPWNQPPNLPAANVVYSLTGGAYDLHGTALVGGRYLWTVDRADDKLVIVDITTNTVVGTPIELDTAVS